MALKPVLPNLEGIPDALKTEYDLKDGQYVLKIEGEIPGLVPVTQLSEVNGKLAEFRENNVGLLRAKTELETRLKGFEGIDPAEYVSLKTKIADLEKRGITKDSDVNVIAQKAVEAAVAPLQKRLDEVTAREKAAEEREKKAAQELARSRAEQELTQIGLRLGVDEKAVPDYVRRGLEVFRLEEGRLVAKNGDTPLYSKIRASEPLTPEEWAKDLMSDAPHLFKRSGGGGAAPGGGAPAGPKRVIANDPVEIGRNIEAIAKGEAIVAPA